VKLTRNNGQYWRVRLQLFKLPFLLPQCQLVATELGCGNRLGGIDTETVARFYVLRYFIDGILTFTVQLVLCQTLDADFARTQAK
jgi:hypothetical protein